MLNEKSNSAIRFCKICFNQIKGYSPFSLLLDQTPICSSCLRKLHPDVQTTFKQGVRFTSVYEYRDEIRDLLFLFKACGDYELAPVFLYAQAPIFHLKYHDYYLIPSPSYNEREKRRGFSHVIEMFKVLDLPFLDCLKKTKDVKQADLDYAHRQKISKYIRFKGDTNLSNKKLLFVDDVVTSGATALACVSLLKKKHPKTVEVLSMARTLLT